MQSARETSASDESRVTLPAALARPDAFPEPRPTHVQVASTHASWVFIADDEVWKVKRRVDYGFLDYSDRDKRRLCCEAEVRLGARLAPDVYRGVAPVYLGAQGLAFVGPGEVVDHAVRMRRLREGDSARALVQAGQLGKPHLAALSALLAKFYASVPPVPELGAPAVFAANVAENHQQTLPYVGRFVDAQTVQHLYRWQEGALAAATSALGERIAEHRIREGHGDLRLEHVFFPDGAAAPLVIDPIEFNRRFRCLDVGLDVAFLAMELDAAGRRDLGAYFLARFARAANDYGFYPLLQLYLSYRAWVRAKVACFVAADHSIDVEKARRKADEAQRLFAQALAYTEPWSGARHVIAVGGLPASGKSTLADALSYELQIPAISSDPTRKALGGLAATERGDSSLYSAEMTKLTYDEVLRRARRVLRSGRGVILDATFGDAAARAAARTLARNEGRPFLFVHLTCDEATLRERLRARAAIGGESDAREELLPLMTARFQPPAELAPGERLEIAGPAGTAAVLDALRRH